MGAKMVRRPTGSPPEVEGESKETPRPRCTDLLSPEWLQEKEEEEGSLQEQPGIIPEDNSSQGLPHNNSPADAAEGLWPPSGDNKEEHLEPRVNEASVKRILRRPSHALASVPSSPGFGRSSKKHHHLNLAPARVGHNQRGGCWA